jgi:hypothetical protein
MFDGCTTGDTVHIDAIFKFLPHTHTHTRVNMGASIFFTAAMILRFRSPRSCRRVVCLLCTNARCTVNTDLLVWYSNTQNAFSLGAAIFSLHTLASSSGRNMNCDENTLLGKIYLSCSFYLYRFRKYVSYGFPIINICNPGVHYETPCINIACVVTCFGCPQRTS